MYSFVRLYSLRLPVFAGKGCSHHVLWQACSGKASSHFVLSTLVLPCWGKSCPSLQLQNTRSTFAVPWSLSIFPDMRTYIQPLSTLQNPTAHTSEPFEDTQHVPARLGAGLPPGWQSLSSSFPATISRFLPKPPSKFQSSIPKPYNVPSSSFQKTSTCPKPMYDDFIVE